MNTRFDSRKAIKSYQPIVFSVPIESNPGRMGFSASTAERSLVLVEQALDRVAQVLHEMKAVSDLHGVRCALGDRLGVGAGTVAGDDLNARMSSEPRCNGRSFAIRE